MVAPLSARCRRAPPFPAVSGLYNSPTVVNLAYDALCGGMCVTAYRSGSYQGMPEKRTFKVRWIRDGAKAPANLDAAADATVEYNGAEITVK